MWAARQRGEFVRTGWPTKEPYYLPPRAGKIWEKDPPPPSDEELTLIANIEVALAMLRAGSAYSRALVKALEIWEGTCPCDHAERKVRIANSGMKPGTVRQYKSRCKKWVEGQLTGCHESPMVMLE